MTISEQIEKLEKEYSPSGNIPYDNTPDGVRNARSLHDAMQIIRALTAPPTEAEMRKQFEEWFREDTWEDPEAMKHSLYEAWQAAISAFLKGRGV